MRDAVACDRDGPPAAGQPGARIVAGTEVEHALRHPLAYQRVEADRGDGDRRERRPRRRWGGGGGQRERCGHDRSCDHGVYASLGGSWANAPATAFLGVVGAVFVTAGCFAAGFLVVVGGGVNGAAGVVVGVVSVVVVGVVSVAVVGRRVRRGRRCRVRRGRRCRGRRRVVPSQSSSGIAPPSSRPCRQSASSQADTRSAARARRSSVGVVSVGVVSASHDARILTSRQIVRRRDVRAHVHGRRDAVALRVHDLPVGNLRLIARDVRAHVNGRRRVARPEMVAVVEMPPNRIVVDDERLLCRSSRLVADGDGGMTPAGGSVGDRGIRRATCRQANCKPDGSKHTEPGNSQWALHSEDPLIPRCRPRSLRSTVGAAASLHAHGGWQTARSHALKTVGGTW